MDQSESSNRPKDRWEREGPSHSETARRVADWIGSDGGGGGDGGGSETGGGNGGDGGGIDGGVRSRRFNGQRLSGGFGNWMGDEGFSMMFSESCGGGGVGGDGGEVGDGSAGGVDGGSIGLLQLNRSKTGYLPISTNSAEGEADRP